MTVIAAGEPVRMAVCTRKSTPAEQYALLLGIRLFEQSLLDLFGAGVLAGTTHTCIGQEPISVGALSAIDRERDIVVSNHRGHGHFLGYCGEVERLYLEVMGKPGGVCGGRGGSQHLQFRNFYSNGVLGGTLPIAAGMALAEKTRESAAVVVVFLGDGALGEGVVYETLNLTSLWRLPVVFVIEHNGYAQSTPSTLQIAGDVEGRLRTFGIATAVSSDGAAVDAIAARVAESVDAARAGKGPHGVICHTYRLAPHSKGDDTRPADELAAAWARDPLKAARALLPESVAATIDREVVDRNRTARERAIGSATVTA